MRIIGLVNRNSGPGFHRVLMPLLLMNGVDAYITNNLVEEDLEKGCDAIYYSRVVNDELLAKQQQYGFKIILDIDDYWELDKHHIAYSEYQRANFSAIQLKHIRRADLITTTHERLAQEIYRFNKNVIVTPNAIPQHEYFSFEHTESPRVRLFWQGSITHERDIAELSYMAKGITHCSLAEQVMMVMCGMTEHPAWDRMARLYTNNLKLKGTVLPGVSPFDYYKNYQYADICLAPLLNTKFNSLKSNLKVLEAGAAGLPVIASKVNPYLTMPVLYAESKADWLKQVKLLVENPSMRTELGQQLKEWCNQYHNFERINEIRQLAIESILPSIHEIEQYSFS